MNSHMTILEMALEIQQFGIYLIAMSGESCEHDLSLD